MRYFLAILILCIYMPATANAESFTLTRDDGKRFFCTDNGYGDPGDTIEIADSIDMGCVARLYKSYSAEKSIIDCTDKADITSCAHFIKLSSGIHSECYDFAFRSYSAEKSRHLCTMSRYRCRLP